MSGNITPYLNLIPSNNAADSVFMATVALSVQPFADTLAVLSTFATLWDVNTAVGTQLDTLGEWVGQSRDLEVPLTGVYFSFDTAGVGFDQGTWFNAFDPTTELDVLPDDSYRVLLQAKIANNSWNGTIPGAYKVLSLVFPGDQVIVQDNQDMTIYLGVVGPVPLNAVTNALLMGGYLDVKAMGVAIRYYVTPSVQSAPIFGFDVENSEISGFDVGAWGLLAPGV